MAEQPALPSFAAIVVAAGSGSRMGGEVPKQFRNWRGKPLLRHSVEALADAGAAPIVVVIPAGEEERVEPILEGIEGVLLVAGGASRQASVLAGLEALEDSASERVLIHDAARPDLPEAVIARLLGALDDQAGAIPVLPIVDSLVRESAGVMAEKQDRDTIRRVQTPQAFRFGEILAAHRGWQGDAAAGDDAQVLQAAGGAVALVDGDERLRKITFESDLAVDMPMFRTGMGYDVHRLAVGEELWLGGIRIEHDKGLAGHSDADVLLHALTDAILGGCGAGDIGQHFPPSDPQWRGAPSDRFVAHAVSLAAEAGYRVSSADLTIICEAPKIGPHRHAIRAKIANLLSLDTALVNIKATTTESLGFTGRGEGIAAQAVATLQQV